MPKETEIFVGFLRNKGLKLTDQRQIILKNFLKSEKHLSVEDLYRVVRGKDSTIGQATVFRTLKLLVEADIAQEIDFGDKCMRFEHKYKHKHHDHLICTKCSKLIEVVNPQIEKLQNKLCRKEAFLPMYHRLEIFGLCKKCRE